MRLSVWCTLQSTCLDKRRESRLLRNMERGSCHLKGQETEHGTWNRFHEGWNTLGRLLTSHTHDNIREFFLTLGGVLAGLAFEDIADVAESQTFF